MHLAQAKMTKRIGRQQQAAKEAEQTAKSETAEAFDTVISTATQISALRSEHADLRAQAMEKSERIQRELNRKSRKVASNADQEIAKAALDSQMIQAKVKVRQQRADDSIATTKKVKDAKMHKAQKRIAAADVRTHKAEAEQEQSETRAGLEQQMSRGLKKE